jgi:CBS domain-containing protein
MKVKDAMHKGTNCVEPSTAVWEIAKQMRDNDIGAMPVWADGKLVGMVTDRDITCRAMADGIDRGNLTARDVMTMNVVSCSPEDDIAVAVQAMEKKKVRRLPVTDSQRGMVGMLSLGDVSHKLNNELSGEVLRAVSAHHS